MLTETPKPPRRSKTRASAKSAPASPATASKGVRPTRHGRAERTAPAARGAKTAHAALPVCFGIASDADLRHRLISEAAYALYAERGYKDGYDVDDWLEAEGRIDGALLDAEARGDEEPGAS